MKMFELGGRELVMEKSKYGYNALHNACVSRGSTEAIMKMIEFGGRELVMEKNTYGTTNNTLYYACTYRVSTKVILTMIELGGRELVMKKINIEIMHYIMHAKIKLQLKLS